MSRIFYFVAFTVTMAWQTSCQRNDSEKSNPLVGTWELYDVEYLYDNNTYTGGNDNNSYTSIRVYTSDSLVFDLAVVQNREGREYIPLNKQHYTFRDREKGDNDYREDGYKCQLQLTGDTLMRLKKLGNTYSFRRTSAFDEDMQELIPICNNDNIIPCDITPIPVNFSHKKTLHEKEQAGTINILFLLLCTIGTIIIGLAIYIGISIRRRNLMRQQLKRLQDEKANMSTARIKASTVAEQEFWNSEFYADFCSRVSHKMPFDEDYWIEVEQQVNTTFPRFISNLRSLVKLSRVEFHTCLLIKLRVFPSDIAPIIYRETSTVSSIRSRLYKKVFGKNGSSQEWDDFIMTI